MFTELQVTEDGAQVALLVLNSPEATIDDLIADAAAADADREEAFIAARWARLTPLQRTKAQAKAARWDASLAEVLDPGARWDRAELHYDIAQLSWSWQALLVLHTIAAHQDGNLLQSSTAMERTLAHETGLPVTVVRRVLQRLLDFGLLVAGPHGMRIELDPAHREAATAALHQLWKRPDPLPGHEVAGVTGARPNWGRWLWEHRLRAAAWPASWKAVGWTIAANTNRDGAAYAAMTAEEIARQSGVSVRTVQEVLSWFKHLGYVDTLPGRRNRGQWVGLALRDRVVARLEVKYRIDERQQDAAELPPRKSLSSRGNDVVTPPSVSTSVAVQASPSGKADSEGGVRTSIASDCRASGGSGLQEPVSITTSQGRAFDPDARLGKWREPYLYRHTPAGDDPDGQHDDA